MEVSEKNRGTPSYHPFSSDFLYKPSIIGYPHDYGKLGTPMTMETPYGRIQGGSSVVEQRTATRLLPGSTIAGALSLAPKNSWEEGTLELGYGICIYIYDIIYTIIYIHTHHVCM